MSDTATPSVHDLAQSLTEDLNQVSANQHAQALNELDEFIASVPERTELTNTRRFFYGGPLLAIVPIILTVFAATRPDAHWGGVLALFALSAACLLLGYVHRNAGKEVHLVLTHKDFQVFNLSAPVPWSDVTDYIVRDDYLTQILFDIRPDATLPVARRIVGLFPSQGLVFFRRKPPKIMVWSAGLKVLDGPKLDCDDIAGMLDCYMAVGQAIAERDALRSDAGA